jgi:hypothetical protein
MARLSPRRPSKLPKYSELCLQALVENGLSDVVSLGGAFALLHYLDHRETRDVDAWWSDSAAAEDRRRVVSVLETVLQPFGNVRTRSWGDVVSIELEDDDGGTFGFQLANRSAALEKPLRAGWIDIPVDSFKDLLASKMVALVERGAPRDFRDIYAVCQAGLASVSQCWNAWAQRQEAAGSDADRGRACLAVESHLARIVVHRPLDTIVSESERTQAKQLRDWFIRDFLGRKS